MKRMILPVFLALCLGVAPVLGQAQASKAGSKAASGAAKKTESAAPDESVVAAATVETAVTEEAAVEAQEISAAAPVVSAVTTEPPALVNDVPAAPTEQQAFGSSVPSMARAFGGLGLVLCLLVGGYMALRKFAPAYFPKMSSGGKNLKIVESIGMGDRRSIALVEVGEKRFLVGSTPQQINLLTVLPEHFSLVDEQDNGAVNLQEEGEKLAFRNLFDGGKKRHANHSRNVLPDEVRHKMRRLREALDNR